MTGTVQVYGASDDLIEVDGAISEEFGYTYRRPEDDNGDLLAFSDGTLLRIRYTDSGIWRITPVAYGSATFSMTQATEDDEQNYTDKATLEGDLRWVVHGSSWAKASAR